MTGWCPGVLALIGMAHTSDVQGGGICLQDGQLLAGAGRELCLLVALGSYYVSQWRMNRWTDLALFG
jgi:hypothetical protein